MNRLGNPFFNLAAISVFAIGLAICGGCRLISENVGRHGTTDEGGFIAPLQIPGSKQLSGLPQRTERKLCLETAKTLAQQGHASEAIQLYEKAESLAPSASRLDLELAPLYAQTGDSERSILRYENAIADGKDSEDVFNNLAWTLAESEKLDEASVVIHRGLQQTPNSERLRGIQAVVFYRQGQREKAMQTFKDLYGDSAANHNMAVLDVQYGSIDSAVEHANRANEDSGCDKKSKEFRDALVAANADSKR